jgi:hypothetical protein
MNAGYNRELAIESSMPEINNEKQGDDNMWLL